MPWTVYRYILRELLKLLVVTTVVLVTVISFAAAIKPMTDGIGPAQLFKFVLYSAPTMLGFALPFAGAFASTLVFIRLASDNELLACSASGMSYRTILLPIVGLGLVLTMSLFFMSNFVIPRFYKAVERTVESDMMTLMVNQLNTNPPFDYDDIVLYADRATERELTPELVAQIDSPFPPSRLVELRGVAVGELDARGQFRGDATAERATALLFRDPDTEESWVQIRLRNATYYDPLARQLFSEALIDLLPLPVPNPFKDDPKFLSWPELRRLGEQPERYDEVGQYKRELWSAIAADQLRRLIVSTLEAGRPVTMDGLLPGHHYTLTSPSVQANGDVLELGKGEAGSGREPVWMVHRAPSLTERRYEASSALLVVESTPTGTQPSVLVDLLQARVYEAGQRERYTEHERLELPRMVWPEPVTEAVLAGTTIDGVRSVGAFELLDLAQASPELMASRPVLKAWRQLATELKALRHEVKAQLHERAASAIACLLLLVLGAVLSMQLKGQMPLLVYFWSFLLAILTIILIHTGGNMAGDDDYPLFVGLAVLWGGNVILIVATAWLYCRLARN